MSVGAIQNGWVVGKREWLTRPDLFDVMFEGCSRSNDVHFALEANTPNIRALGRLGVRVNTKIMDNFYDWPHPPHWDAPFKHQIDTANAMAVYPRVFIFNEMALGKTASTLWALDFLRKQGQIKRTLIVCTPSCVYSVWEEHVREMFPGSSIVDLVGTKKRRLRRLEEGIERGESLFCINHDGIAVIQTQLERLDWDCLVIDEVSFYRNADSKRSKAIQPIAWKTPRLFELSGTIIPKLPSDVWGPAFLAFPDEIPGFDMFKNMTDTKIWIDSKKPGKRGFYKEFARPDGVEIAHRYLHPAVRYKKSDTYKDMPDTVHVTRNTELSSEQKKLIKNIEEETRETIRTLEGNKITPKLANQVSNKIMQVCAGVIYVNDERHQIGAPNRVAVVKELIDQCPSKAVLVNLYQESGDYLMDQLKEYQPARIDGTISASKKKENLHRFKHDGKCRLAIVHPKSAGHGLNMQHASLLMWYGATSDAEWWQQTNERLARPGQKHQMTIAKLISRPEERNAFDVAAGRAAREATFYDYYQRTLGDKND